MTRVEPTSAAHPFKDHFSGHSGEYADFRPNYPESLFAFLADCCTRRELAWDCATGNGQAASRLARYFDKVVASDASEAQIQTAESHPRIEFRIATAEESALPEHSIDLITVAQALHWFDIARFFDEAQRVLTSGGVLAFWCYRNCSVDARCNALIDELYADIVHGYWPAERKMVEEGYQSIEMPMPAIAAPQFVMTTDWTAEDMLGYLRTWSASQRYLKARGRDPVAFIERRLVRVWGGGCREVSWPLNLRIGRA